MNDRFQYGNRRQGNRSNISAATSGVTTSAYVDDRDADDMDILDDLDTPRGPQNMGNPSIPQNSDFEEDDLLEEAVSPLGHQQIDDPFGARDVDDIGVDQDIGGDFDNPMVNQILMYDVDDVQFGVGDGVITKD